jgi:hypothetical protein
MPDNDQHDTEAAPTAAAERADETTDLPPATRADDEQAHRGSPLVWSALVALVVGIAGALIFLGTTYLGSGSPKPVEPSAKPSTSAPVAAPPPATVTVTPPPTVTVTAEPSCGLPLYAEVRAHAGHFIHTIFVGGMAPRSYPWCVARTCPCHPLLPAICRSRWIASTHLGKLDQQWNAAEMEKNVRGL